MTKIIVMNFLQLLGTSYKEAGDHGWQCQLSFSAIAKHVLLYRAKKEHNEE